MGGKKPRKTIIEKQKRKNFTSKMSKKKRKQRLEDLKEGRAIPGLPWQLAWDTRRDQVSRQRVTELEAKVKEIEAQMRKKEEALKQVERRVGEVRADAFVEDCHG